MEGVYQLVLSANEGKFSLTRSFMVASVNRNRVFIDISLNKDLYNFGETAFVNVSTSILDSTTVNSGLLSIYAVLNQGRYTIVSFLLFFLTRSSPKPSKQTK